MTGDNEAMGDFVAEQRALTGFVMLWPQHLLNKNKRLVNILVRILGAIYLMGILINYLHLIRMIGC